MIPIDADLQWTMFRIDTTIHVAPLKKERKYAAITISLLNNTLLVLIFSIHRLSINVFPFPIVCVGDCYNNECCNTNKA